VSHLEGFTQYIDELQKCMILDRAYHRPLPDERGSLLVLAQKYYVHAGKSGIYTRKRGLDRNTNKELLLKHIRANRTEGARLADLLQVLPSHSENQV
jgi:hypothetical protein